MRADLDGVQSGLRSLQSALEAAYLRQQQLDSAAQGAEGARWGFLVRCQRYADAERGLRERLADGAPLKPKISYQPMA